MQLLVEKCNEADILWLDEFLDLKSYCLLSKEESIPQDFTGLILRVDGFGLSLRDALAQNAAPTRVDFLSNRLQHRVRTSNRRQGLLKAVGLDKTSDSLSVLDATAGLGADAWSLAALGCKVHMLEKSGLMAALLFDGLRRIRQEASGKTLDSARRLKLTHTDFIEFLAKHDDRPDVIVLDPMFPPRTKSAKVNKDMALMQQFLPVNDDVEELLALARERAGKRVVLKRPGKSDKSPSPAPDFQVPGKACHFQVFLAR